MRLIIHKTDLMLIKYFQFDGFHVSKFTHALYQMFFLLIIEHNKTNIDISKVTIFVSLCWT